MANVLNRPIIPFDEGWEVLRKAIDKLEEMLNGGILRSKFEIGEYIGIYTQCYDMSTQRKPYNWSRELYQRHGETIDTYLITYVLPELREKNGQDRLVFLSEFQIRWSNHQIMNKWLKKFFVYLDRHYVKKHNLPSLIQAGLQIFRDQIYEEFKRDVTESLLQMITSERDEKIIDKSLIKNIIEIFESMGIGSLDVYNADFEAPLLASTREYYMRKREDWILTDSTPDYLMKAETALNDERNRVSEYLNQSSEEKLLRVVEEALLENLNIELLEKECSGCRFLLANDKSEDLQRMFRLFSRLENGLNPMVAIFESFITGLGMDIIHERQARLDSGEKEKPDDPKFVKSLIDLHDKYLAVVRKDFSDHSLFQKALKDAFVEVMNKDVGNHTNAELMSTYCDRVLKSGGEKLSNVEVEESLDKMVQLFSYLSDKDLFADIYRHHLAKRLLNQRSANDHAEKVMIAKLKMKCGTNFTSEMEEMLADLALGCDQRNEYDSWVRERHTQPEFSVQVLTTGFWPTYKSLEVTVTPEMNTCMDLFREWHDRKYQHRKLTWVLSLGYATVCATFGEKSYDLQVNTLQAIAMNVLNDNKILSYNELSSVLNLEESILDPLLHSLCCGKYKIINKNPASNKINNTDIFSANTEFSSNTRKIRIPMASIDTSDSTKRVEEGRSIAIEAAIVRIMKARKTLQHQQLIAEVLSQLALFKPEPRVIKKRIEALIERKYLEQSHDNTQVYDYLA